VDRTGAVVTVPRGIRLDLGATAKAWAADRAAEAAARTAACGALVAIGGDIATAGTAPAEGWLVRVADDHRRGESDLPGQNVTIRSGGLATSSTTVRRWTTRRGEAHHLIDPRIGRPVRGRWRTVSVAAGSCADANIASTAAIVRSDRACAWLEARRLPARLVDQRGNTTEIAGWPAP
jgi:thiamine biosynthesis lipoprotein